MAIQLQPAINTYKPLKVLLYGPTYSGKTLSSIRMAAGAIMKIRKCSEVDAYKHMVLIDTEYGRAKLHRKIGPWNHIEIKAPYFTEKLVDIVQELNTMDNIDVIIVDSLTHFWVKEGGILEQKAAKDKQGGNSYTNWLDYTAKFNKMLDILLASPKHVFATARGKSEVILVENDKGKQAPKVVGTKPELREGVDFDFDIVFNVDKDTHNLIVEKGLDGIDPIIELGTPEFGGFLYDLFTTDTVIAPREPDEYRASIRAMAKAHSLITFIQLKLSGRKLDDIDITELQSIEADMLAEIKKNQVKK